MTRVAAEASSAAEAAPTEAPATVTVRLYAAARAAAGGRSEIVVPAGSVRDVVERVLADAPPRLGEVVRISSLMCDGVRLDRSDGTVLPAGATVDVLPPFAGG